MQNSNRYTVGEPTNLVRRLPGMPIGFYIDENDNLNIVYVECDSASIQWDARVTYVNESVPNSYEPVATLVDKSNTLWILYRKKV